MAETVITSCCYFPPILFFREFVKAKKLVVDVHEYFIKQTLRNRTYICSASGKVPLIIPVQHTGGKLTAVKDIMISYDASWQKNQWRSITSAYRNSAWFEFMEDDLAPFFFNKEKFLCDLNEKILHTLLKLCRLKITVTRSGEYIKEYPGQPFDLRNLAEMKNFNEYSEVENTASYSQVFSAKLGFTSGLSILDLLFNQGKHTPDFLGREA